MRYHTSTPVPQLADYVESLWLVVGDGVARGRDRVLPQGSPGLIVELPDARIQEGSASGQLRSTGAFLYGVQDRHDVIDTPGAVTVLGVQFRPGGALPFFGHPMSDLGGTAVPLDALWGRRAEELRERLAAAPTADDMFAAVDGALVAHSRGEPEARRPIAMAIRALSTVPHARRISELAEGAGLSRKRFIEVFREHVGLAPKRFQRLRRFQSAVRLMHRRPDAGQIRVALVAGYCDQPHFSHEFREFAGMTPGAYLANRGENVNHVALS